MKRPRTPGSVEVVKPQGPTELDRLAKQIQAAHENVIAATFDAFEHAIAAGNLLLEAKGQVGHGKWSPWLERHIPDISGRTARVYMRLAQNAPTLLKADRQHAADLTIRAALDLIPKTRVSKRAHQNMWKRHPPNWKCRGCGRGLEILDTFAELQVQIRENPDAELIVRAEFRRWARLLAREVSESEFRSMVEETCREIYGLSLAFDGQIDDGGPLGRDLR